MKICFEAPDEWESMLDELAKQDGHSNRGAVIRKIINLFFANKSHFIALSKQKETCTEKEPKK